MRAMDDPTDEPDRRPALTLLRGGKASPGPTRARLNLDKIASNVRPEFDERGRGGVVLWWDHPRAYLTLSLTPEGAYQLGEQLQTAALVAGWEP